MSLGKYSKKELLDEISKREQEELQDGLYTLPKKNEYYEKYDNSINELLFIDTRLMNTDERYSYYICRVQTGSEPIEYITRVKTNVFQHVNENKLKETIRHAYLCECEEYGTELYYEDIEIYEIAAYGFGLITVDITKEIDLDD